MITISAMAGSSSVLRSRSSLCGEMRQKEASGDGAGVGVSGIVVLAVDSTTTCLPYTLPSGYHLGRRDINLLSTWSSANTISRTAACAAPVRCTAKRLVVKRQITRRLILTTERIPKAIGHNDRLWEFSLGCLSVPQALSPKAPVSWSHA